jgi:hypothetical protein
LTDANSTRILTPVLDRRAFLRAAAAASAGGAALYLAGCGTSNGGNGDAGTPGAAATNTVVAPGSGAVRPLLLTREFVVNEDNRFLIGLQDGAGKFVKDATVHLRFFKIGADGSTGSLRAEGDMHYLELKVPGAHTHDGMASDAVAEDSVSFYAATTPFEEAGAWGVEVAVKPKTGPSSTVQLPIDVLAEPQTPAYGTLPPASQNDTAATNMNAESLCSRDPICGLHDKVIRDVLGKGRPLVVQFSTPAYCQTRFCGPVLEVLLGQVPVYQDRVDFVHIEVFKDFQLQQYRQAVEEWNLPGEPYTFFMGADGTVRGRLEAIFTTGELVQRLDALVTS